MCAQFRRILHALESWYGMPQSPDLWSQQRFDVCATGTASLLIGSLMLCTIKQSCVGPHDAVNCMLEAMVTALGSRVAFESC